MENEPYDYRQYDQIWRRVAPQENPYPEVRRAGMTPRNSGSAPAPSNRAVTPRDTRGQMGMTTPNTTTPNAMSSDMTRPNAMASDMTRPNAMAPNMMTQGMMTQDAASGEAMRSLLREELRHMTQVLQLLENGLA